MRPRLPFTFLFFVICYLLFVPSPLLAQEATPVSSPSAQTSAAKNPLEDFINSLVGKDIPDTLEKINKASLPYGVGQGIKPVVDPKKEKPEEKKEELDTQENVKGESTVDTDPACKAATHYTVAEWVRTPKTGEESRSINIANFFKKLFGDLLDFLGIRDTGNKEAKKFASTGLPKDVPDKLLGKQPINPNLYARSLSATEKIGNAGGSAQVLGLISSEQDAMIGALSLAQCGSLPPSLCMGNVLEIPSTTPGPITPTPVENPQPTPSGKCGLGTGYCSVESLKGYVKEIFGLKDEQINETSMMKASKICMVESHGNPFALNEGCLEKKSVDYSVGLFQINLLAHCPGAFSDYTWNPPSCTIASMDKLTECKDKYFDVRENIKKAWEISVSGKDWSDWGAAEYCGIT